MHHREVVLSAQKRPKLAFLSLPEDLQDEIIDGLDSGAITLPEAAELVRARGQKLSHEAIARYYRLVRREQKIRESKQDISRPISRFARQSP